MRIAFISDVHVPFQDHGFVKYTLAHIARIKPDVIVAGGDWCDWYVLSSFNQDPSRLTSLQSNLDETNDLLGKFSCHTERLIFIPGNHEDRLERYKRRKAPELHSLRNLTLHNLLELGTIDNAELTSLSDPEFRYRDFVFIHGYRLSIHSAYTARMHQDVYSKSGVNGHSHRVGLYSVAKDGNVYTWYEAGGLFDRKKVDWHVGPVNWQNGFIVFEFNDKTDQVKAEIFGDVACKVG